MTTMHLMQDGAINSKCNLVYYFQIVFSFFTPLNTAAEHYEMNTENTGLSILNHLKNFTNEVLVSCCETRYSDILQ